MKFLLQQLTELNFIMFTVTTLILPIFLLDTNNVDDSNHNDDEIEKTLAILIGLIAGVALIIVFLSFLSKVCEKHKGMLFLFICI